MLSKRIFGARQGNFARAILAGTLLLAVMTATALPPAQAEGFPGTGNRLLYADALPHYNLGNRYLEKEWYEKAVEKYNDAINIYPYDVDVYINLGMALRKMQDNAGAEKAFRKALELNDKDWMTWSNLGNMIMMQDRFMEALECFEKAFKCNPPAADKKAMEENITGIKKILKNRDGIDLDAIAAAKAAAAKAPGKGGKGKGTRAVATRQTTPSARKPVVDASTQATVSSASRKETNVRLAGAPKTPRGDSAAQPSVRAAGERVKELDSNYESWLDGRPAQ